MRPATRIGSTVLKRATRTPLRAQISRNCIIARPAPITSNAINVRAFQTSVGRQSIMPDAENPPPKVSESHEEPTAATDITTEEFHERADAYLNELVERLEEAQEKDPQIEVEYAVSSIYSKQKIMS